MQRPFNRAENVRVAADAEYDVRLRDFRGHLLAIPLRQAARYDECPERAARFELRKLQDRFDAFTLGILNEAACIDDNHIALRRVGADFIASFFNLREQPLRVHLIF